MSCVDALHGVVETSTIGVAKEGNEGVNSCEKAITFVDGWVGVCRGSEAGCWGFDGLHGGRWLT